MLLLGGSEDMATPPETLQALAAECGGAPLEILENLGHVPSVEFPEALAKRLLLWMAPDRSQVGEQGVAYAEGLETRKQVLGEAHVARSTENATSLDALSSR